MISINQDKILKIVNTSSRIKPPIKTANTEKISNNIPQNQQNIIQKRKEYFKKNNSNEKKETKNKYNEPSYSSPKNANINGKNIAVYQLNSGKDKNLIKHKTNLRMAQRKILNENLPEKSNEKEHLLQKYEKYSFVAKKVTESNLINNINISNPINHKNSCSVCINNSSKEVKKFRPKKKLVNEGLKEIKSSFINSHINNNIPNNNINLTNKNGFILLPNLKCKRRKTSAQSKQIQYISVGGNKENVNSSSQQQENRENDFKQLMTFSQANKEIPKIKNQNMEIKMARLKNRNKYCIVTKNSKEKNNKIPKKEIKVIINIKDISNSSTVYANNNKNNNHLIKSTSDDYYSQVKNNKNKKISHNNSNFQKNYIKKFKEIKSEKTNNSPKTIKNNNNNYNSSNNNNFSTNNSSSHIATSQKNNLSCQLLNEQYKINKKLSQSSKSIIEKKIQSVRESNKMNLSNTTNKSLSNFTYIDKQPINNNSNNYSSKWDNKCYIPIVSASLVCGNKENPIQNFSLNLRYKNKSTEDYDITENKQFLRLSNCSSFRERRNKHKTERNKSMNSLNKEDSRLSLDYSLFVQERKLDEIHDELKNCGVFTNKRKNYEHSVDSAISKEYLSKTFNNHGSLKDIYSGKRIGLLNEMRKIKYENVNTEE